MNVSGRGDLFAQAGERRTIEADWTIDLGPRHPHGQTDYNMWTSADPDPDDNHLGSVWVFVGLETPATRFTSLCSCTRAESATPQSWRHPLMGGRLPK